MIVHLLYLGGKEEGEDKDFVEMSRPSHERRVMHDLMMGGWGEG